MCEKGCNDYLEVVDAVFVIGRYLFHQFVSMVIVIPFRIIDDYVVGKVRVIGQ